MKTELEQKIHEFAELMYKLGYGNGRASSDEYGKGYDDGIDVGYLNGLNDAWECARKIVCDKKFSYEVLEQIFGTASFRTIFATNSASEVIAKIKEYEEKNTEEQGKKDCKHCAETYGAIGCFTVGCEEGHRKYEENQKQTEEWDSETMYGQFYEDAIGMIESVPSVQPKVKTGHWITQWNLAHQKEYYYCSECREEYSYDGETGIKMNDYKYCPNCGAKMENR